MIPLFTSPSGHRIHYEMIASAYGEEQVETESVENMKLRGK